LSRSSGATLLLELGLLRKVVHLRYFTSGLFRRNHDSIFLHPLAIHMYCFASLRKKKQQEKKGKRKERKKEKKKRIVANK